MTEQQLYNIQDYLREVKHNLRVYQSQVVDDDIYSAEMLGDLIAKVSLTDILIAEANEQ